MQLEIEEFAEYVRSHPDSVQAVTITQDGQRIGVYRPVARLAPREPLSPEFLERLERAHEETQRAIAEAGTNEEELMADYWKLHYERRDRKLREMEQLALQNGKEPY
jgi:hypothetical protein